MQYLDDMILEREKANDALREELTKYVGWCQMLDQSQVIGHFPITFKYVKGCYITCYNSTCTMYMVI